MTHLIRPGEEPEVPGVEVLYRYERGYYSDNSTRVILNKYNVVRKTPGGYWIKIWEYSTNEKWVSNNSRKRYAYPTKEEALTNFIARTKRSLIYCKRNLEAANRYLQESKEMAKDMLPKECDNPDVCFNKNKCLQCV